MNEPALLRAMLEPTDGRLPRIAVVGLSGRPERPSHYVSRYMQQQGYPILPVNPELSEVLGEPCVAALSELRERPDLVNVFRLPRVLPGIVEEMIQLGLRRIWVQQGIVHVEAARMAEAAGIDVVMDRCIMVEHRRLFG